MKKVLLGLISLAIWFSVGLITIFVTIPLLLYTLFFWWLDSSRRFQHRLGILWGWGVVHLNPFLISNVNGLENFPKKGAFVVVSNHTSLADIIILYRLNRQFKWLAKESLFKIPLFGWAMSACGYISLERGDHASIRDSFEKALKWLKKDIPVLVFPEGTRSSEGHLGQFRNGAFKLALKAKCPVLPIVIKGSKTIIEKGSWIMSGKTYIQLHVLPPIDVQPYEPDHFEKLNDKTRDVMAVKLAGISHPA